MFFLKFVGSIYFQDGLLGVRDALFLWLDAHAVLRLISEL